MEYHNVVIAQAVHYVAYDGTCLAAIVISLRGNEKVDLVVFTSLNANNVAYYGVQFHQDVSYAFEHVIGTWHHISFH